MTTVFAHGAENHDAPHIPVLLSAVLDAMPAEPGKVLVDGTFGAGGYSRALLNKGVGTLYAIDRDPSVEAFAAPLATEFGDRFTLLQGRFSEMERLLAEQGITRIDGIVLDLGVSSMQLDQAARGFSFRFDGPLDMRMGPDAPTAASVVNQLEENALADIIYELGEERRARQVARAIVNARATQPIETTFQLAEIVRGVVRKSPKDKIDPATRTFMALRLYVNDELGEVRRALIAAERLLAPGGVLAVVSFHSLEDRLVKLFLRDRASPIPPGASRHLPLPARASDGEPARQPTFKLSSRQGVVATEDELAANPRARSARLRHAIRTEAPAWEVAA